MFKKKISDIDLLLIYHLFHQIDVTQILTERNYVYKTTALQKRTMIL